MKPIFTFCFLAGLPLFAFAQARITGVVTNTAGEELPFVHILANGQKNRVYTSEVNGEFSIPLHPPVASLTFSYVGYTVQKIDLPDVVVKPLRIVLIPDAYTLQEAVVIAGENPAHRIIRLAEKNRNRNNPEKLQGYQYRAFTKVTLKLLPDHEELARRKARYRDRFGEADMNADTTPSPFLSDAHVFLMETLTDHAVQKPHKKRDEVLRHRTSGMKEPWLASLALQLQPFSFYADELPFLEKRYLNPIAPGSTGRYRFRLEDTFTEGADSIFVISYQPNPGTAFSGLKGMLHIHSAGYAIRHLIAESADEEQIRFHIDQKYSRVANGQWFPEQLSLVLEAPKYPNPAIGTRMSSRTYLDSIRINPAYPKDFFSVSETYFTAPDVNQQDSLLALSRKEPVSLTDSVTYVLWDSIGRKINLDNKMRLLEFIAAGAIPMGKIDWMYIDLLRTSTFEGLSPGLGLRTSERLSKHVQLRGYAGYAFRAKQWKYAGTFSWFPRPGNRYLVLGIEYSNDLMEPATLDFPIKNQLVNRRYFARRMDRQERIGAFFSFRPIRSLEVRGSFQQQQHTPLFEYRYLSDDGTPVTDFTFTEAELYLRYAHGLKSYRILGTEADLQSKYPILSIRVAKGFKGLWNGAYEYWRVNAMLDYKVTHRRLGGTRIVAEAGWCAPDLPYSKQFTAIGTGGGWDAVSLSTAFETMQPYEFVSSRIANIYIEHTFNRLTKKLTRFQPQPAIIHRMGWGGLNRPQVHELEGVRSMEQGYFESGVALRSIVRFNYLNFMYIGLGVKALYRYGAYQLPELKDNLAFRLILDVSR